MSPAAHYNSKTTHSKRVHPALLALGASLSGILCLFLALAVFKKEDKALTCIDLAQKKTAYLEVHAAGFTNEVDCNVKRIDQDIEASGCTSDPTTAFIVYAPLFIAMLSPVLMCMSRHGNPIHPSMLRSGAFGAFSFALLYVGATLSDRRNAALLPHLAPGTDAVAFVRQMRSRKTACITYN